MSSSSSWFSQRRALLSSLAVVVVLLSLLALPPVRAAADQLLSVFRVQKVVFLPVDQDRLKQLADLNFDKDTLFVSKPTVENRTPPRTVGSAAEASSALGYQLAQPSSFPSAPISTEFKVSNPNTAQFQVNVASVRQLLSLMNINDVTIPDALGASPIKVAVPTLASASYHGLNYDMTLHQGRSPDVTLPDGVELSQLGNAALRLFGMDAQEAEAVSQSINWNNTLLFPFPKDTSNLRQVTVGGEQGMLVSGGHDGEQHWQLYWQHDGGLYVLQASGSLDDAAMVSQLIATAESVK